MDALDPTQALRVAVAPAASAQLLDAVCLGGGTPVELSDQPAALVWTASRDTDRLREALAVAPGLRWVQLPSAGIEAIVAAGLVDAGRVWTSAKGAYAEPVAEHALALALAGLRGLAERARARSWGHPGGTSLYEAPVVIVGAGGITAALLGLLAPFRARVTVVRRRVGDTPGAGRTVTTEHLQEVLPEALVVFLAAALTPETVGLIGRAELALMSAQAWIVNVARGALIDTGALVEALEAGRLGGAALDVTDPEPLPDGHPLWTIPNCLVTPHTADTPEMTRPLLARRVAENVRRYRTGRELIGVVDPHAGY